MNYKTIKNLEYESSFDSMNKYEYQLKTINTTRASKVQINRLIKKLLPNVYEELELEKFNPYPYKKNSHYLILNVRGKEHFFKYETI